MRGLVNGLQNRVHPFESGTDLKFDNNSISFLKDVLFCFLCRNPLPYFVAIDSNGNCYM